MIAVALRTLLFFIVACGAAQLLRRRSAAERSLWWSAVLASSLLVPLAVLFVPTIPIVSIAAVGSTASETVPPSSIVPSVLLIVWLVGCGVCLVRNAIGVIALARRRRHARALSSPAWTRIAAEVKLPRRVRLLESSEIVAPCTWGTIAPVILLPSDAKAWPEASRRNALLHELAHVRRFDHLGSLIADLACAIHWFDPIVWFAARQARESCEQACDDAVLRAGARPTDYAQLLLDLARASDRTPRSLVAAMAIVERTHFHARLASIVRGDVIRPTTKRWQAIASGTFVLAIAIVVGAAGATASEQISSITSTQPLQQRETPRAIAVVAPKHSARIRRKHDRPASTRPEPIASSLGRLSGSLSPMRGTLSPIRGRLAPLRTSGP